MVSRPRAYNADPKVKEAALAVARSLPEMGGIWSPMTLDSKEIEAFCHANGFAPAFFHLTRALVGPSSQDDSEALIATLAGLPLSSDTTAIVVDFYLWLWEGRGDASLEKVLRGTAAFAPAAELISLQRAENVRDLPSRVWRSARNAVFNAESLSISQRGAASIVADMGWDLVSTPAAAADVIQTIFSTLFDEIKVRLGWTESDSAAAQSAITRQFAVAVQELGPHPDRNDREAFTRYSESVREIAKRVATDDENKHMQRMEERSSVASKEAGQLREELRKGFMQLVRVARTPVQTSA